MSNSTSVAAGGLLCFLGLLEAEVCVAAVAAVTLAEGVAASAVAMGGDGLLLTVVGVDLTGLPPLPLPLSAPPLPAPVVVDSGMLFDIKY